MLDLKEKKILITGGTGFIGSAIVNKLLSFDCSISIISLPKDTSWRIDNIKKCKFFHLDLIEFNPLKQILENIKPNIIIHLAALVDPERNLNTINKMFSINLGGTKNLLLALENINYDLFINTGTSDEYGRGRVPYSEDYKENPVSPYAVSKVAATYLCEMINKVYNKPIITVRPFLPYGPKQLSNALIPSLISAGMNKKKLDLTSCLQTRDFIYIEDLVDAYIKLAINADIVKNLGIFNIATGTETKIIDVVNLVKNEFKDNKFNIGGIPYRAEEQMHHYANINKIKNSVNWRPKWDIKKGLIHTIRWWKKNKSKLKSILSNGEYQ